MTYRITCLLIVLILMPHTFGNNLTNFNNQFSLSVAEDLEKYSIPGAAYAIVENDSIVAIETFGHVDKTKSNKVNADTIFRLASVSKQFAATITTMLAHEKQLNLNDSVTKYVPHFSLKKAGSAEKIKLKHLLSHTTGLVPNAYDNMLHENWSMDSIIRRFDRINPICKPEECYGYQNIAYSFLQPAIEASQPKSYSTLLQERIFTPLDMVNASVGIDVYLNKENTAKPHVLDKKIRTGVADEHGNEVRKYLWRTVKVEPDYYKVEPASGINASITDLAKWLIANLGYKPDILSPAILDEVTTPRIKTKRELRRKFWRDHLTDAHYGYGWRIYQFENYPIIYHSGWVSGFRADIGYSPDLDMGFAVFLNAESSVINKISSEFWSQAIENHQNKKLISDNHENADKEVSASK